MAGTADATTNPEYDVAISFLAADERIAGELAGRLSEGLRVFYFPRSQEQLAGTDGMETMRTPFVSASRVVVVLFRELWGKTEWTRLEEAAIKDGCLARGWETLMFVQLDKVSTLPIWLPRTHVRFVLQDYGIDQLVGAIKARVQERGGIVQKPSALSVAKRVQSEAELLADTQKFFRDRAWIESVLHRSVIDANSRAVEMVIEAGKSMTPTPMAGTEKLFCTMTDERVSVAAGWKQEIFNDVGRDAHFFIRNFSGAVAIPGSRTMYAFRPTLLSERKLSPVLTVTRDLAWMEPGKKELLSNDDLSHAIAITFFQLVARANRGEIELPFT